MTNSGTNPEESHRDGELTGKACGSPFLLLYLRNTGILARPSHYPLAYSYKSSNEGGTEILGKQSKYPI